MNCIIQSVQDIAPVHLKRLAGLTTASHIEQISAHAYRLYDAKPHDGVAAYCYEHHLDYGFVRPSQHLSDFGLVVMDMDSTLISIECIDEIADMVHIKPQVAAITEAAMRGEIDFSESLRRRVALLAGLEESALQRVYELKLKAEQVIALGDGANDLKMMAQAGVSIAYHAKPVVLAQASYAFNFVGLDGLVNLFDN